ERDLQNFGGPLERGEAGAGLLHRKLEARESAKDDLAAPRELQRAGTQTPCVEARMWIADLARTDLDAVVVELLAEAKARRVTLVEADRDDCAPPTHHADGLAERGRAAGALERDSDGLCSEVLLQSRCNVALGADRLDPDGTPDLQARGQAIDGVHGRRAGRLRDLRDQKADRAAAEDDDGALSLPAIREPHRVDRDRQHLSEIETIVE